ncbi:MAG: UDP-glucose 4-epimerase [Solirubrobacterales bacterium]|nr:UDP-glucose 4-epimerase [Solirubrobacterales bacterium]
MTIPSELRGTSALVTGGAGFIGGHVVEALLDAGVERVAVLDDFSLGNEANLQAVSDSPALTVERGDCADLAALERLAGEPFDLCFNMAVIPLPASLEDPRRVVDHNIAMTTAVCELGRAGGFGRLVQFSSSEAYGTAQSVPMSEDHPLLPTTPYAASKAATDLIALSYAETFGLEGVVVRPFNTFGPRQNPGAYAGLIPTVIGNVRRGEPVTIHGDGEQTRDYAYVTDVVAGVLAAAASAEATGRSINLGSGEEHTVKELIRVILESLGEPDWPVEHGPDRPGDVRRLLADTTLAAELLGYAPAVGLEEGMRETVSWYLANPDRAASAAPTG